MYVPVAGFRRYGAVAGFGTIATVPDLRSTSDRRAMAVVVFGAACWLLLFGRTWWASEHAPWWSPFALWCVLVFLGAAVTRPAVRDESAERPR